MRVAHREGDWRYPLLVDPVADTALVDGSGDTVCDDAPGWEPEPGSGNFASVLDCTSGVGGIYVYHHGDTDYDAGDHAGASFQAFRQSFIEQWDVYASHAPTGAPGTCISEGIDDPSTSTWNAGAWTHPAGLNPPTGTTPWLVAQGSSGDPNYHGDPCTTLSRHLKTHIPTTPTRGNRARFDLWSLDGVTTTSPTQAYGLMSGSRVYQSDYDTPTVKLTHTGLTSGWVHDDEASVKIEATEPDSGLGISPLQALIPKVGGDYQGTHQIEADPVDCAGGVDDRCPASYSNSLTYDTTGAPEGRLTNYATAYDILGKAPALQSWETKLDRSPPTLDFRGSTIHQGGQTLNESSYDLDVKGTDGSRAAPAQERSGVRDIQVWARRESNTISGDSGRGRIDYPPTAPDDGFERIDGFSPIDCTHPQGSCERSETFEFVTEHIPPGEHTIRVVVADQVASSGAPGWEQPDHAIFKDFTIFVPEHDDERDSDRLGLENWWQYDTTDTGAATSANVNLSNGNLVWHSTPVFNLGRGLSTLVNLTYNSQQRVQLPLLETPVEQLYDPYEEAGRGFSLAISGMTRLNERMNVDRAPSGRVTLTDADGTRHAFQAEAPGSDVFTAPKGVQVHLRRFSKSLGFIDAPVFGFEQLEMPAKAWAVTRPDGVTYYFDQLGYQTSIEDRNGNAISFVYEYRGPTKDACEDLNSPTNLNIFYLPGKLCQKKALSVTDAGGRSIAIAYEARTLAGLAPELVPDTGLPAALVGQTVETPAYASGRVKTITDHGGRVLELAYDGSGNLTAMTQAKGTAAQRQFQFGYEAPQSGLTIRPLTTITDPPRQHDDRGIRAAHVRRRLAHERAAVRP